MYSLTDKQIDFILNDIRARGVETEDLQLNLLDHICCIIENELGENGDFGQFYQRTISRFYKKELRELEDETQTLLTFKHYYTMKKIMFVSGFFSACLMLSGGAFKVMHWPGANVLFMSGIVLFSLLFLPVMFTLKLKEKTEKRDKAVLVFGMIVSILLLFAALFKFMHWAGAGAFGLIAFGTLLLGFLPVYLFTGLKNPATKVNTIVTSILIIAGSAFLLVLPNRSPSKVLSKETINFLRNEEVALSELREVMQPAGTNDTTEAFNAFMNSADKLKDAIIKGIAGVDYRTYLADDENITPQWLTPEQLNQFTETKNYIDAIVELENKTNTKLYSIGNEQSMDKPNRKEELKNVFQMQPHVKDLMCFIANTQTKACLAVTPKKTIAAK